MDFALIRDVADRELGMPLERAFARFDEQLLASASIGQVHRAVLPTGEDEPKPVVEELRTRITEELDYRHEAANQRALGKLYAGHPFIGIPKVFDAHSTQRVLTSEYVHGRTFQHVLELGQAQRRSAPSAGARGRRRRAAHRTRASRAGRGNAYGLILRQ